MAEDIYHVIEGDTLIITCPSGKVVTGAQEPLYGWTKEISKQFKAAGGTFENLMEATLQVWVKNGDVEWDFVDRKKQPIPVGVKNIDRVPTADMAAVQISLMRVFYPDVFEEEDASEVVQSVKDEIARIGEEEWLEDAQKTSTVLIKAMERIKDLEKKDEPSAEGE